MGCRLIALHMGMPGHWKGTPPHLSGRSKCSTTGFTLGWVGTSAQPSAAMPRQGACIMASPSTGSPISQPSKAKQSKTKHNKAKKSETKQNKTKHRNTGLSRKTVKGGSDPCSHVQSQGSCLWPRSECVNPLTGLVQAAGECVLMYCGKVTVTPLTSLQQQQLHA